MIWNSKRKTRLITPGCYKYERVGERQLLIRKGYETSLQRQGLLNPTRLLASTSQPPFLTGRGKVSIIKGHNADAAVRKYRHGGLFRFLTGDLFAFGARPFQEVAVTDVVKAAGIPTLEILAAVKERVWGGWYRGYLVTEYLPTVLDLIQYLDKQRLGPRRREVIKKSAQAVKKMHESGVYHADLHLKNFLVEEGHDVTVYLIDFDKSQVFSHLNTSQRMKNLKRLDRSAEKLRRYGLALSARDKATFCRAYAAGNREIRNAMKRFSERYQWYSLLYRWGWRLSRIFYPRHNPWRKSST